MRRIVTERKGISNVLIVIVVVIILIVAGVGVYLATTLTKGTTTATKLSTLHVTTWGGTYFDAMAYLASEFTNQTGIPVVINQQSAAGQTLASMEASWPNSGIDVATVTAGVGSAMMNLHYLIPLNSSSLSVYSQIPGQFDVNANGSTYALGYELGTFVLAWRADLYPAGATGLTSLFSPALKGHIGIPSVSFFDDAFLLNLALLKGGNEDNIQPGLTIAKQLAPDVGYVYSGDEQAITALQTGQVWVEYMITADFLQAQSTLNNPAENVTAIASFNDTKTITALDVIVVPKGPNEAEALKFVNFVMSASSQRYWGNNVGILPANSQASVPTVLASYIPTVSAAMTSTYVPNPVVVAADESQWTSEWNTQVQPLIP